MQSLFIELSQSTDMPFKEAFAPKNNFIMVELGFTPSDQSFSNPQVDAYNEPKKDQERTEKVNKKLDEVRQAYGPAWHAATYGEIKPYQPTTWDSWYDRSQNNILSKITYDMADGIWVTAQSLVIGPEARHINGTQVSGYDRTDAFVTSAELGLTAGELSSFKAIKGGYYSSRWGLRIQSHTHPLNPISGRGYSGSKAVSHLNINKFHIIYNPMNWKGWSRYPYLPFRY